MNGRRSLWAVIILVLLLAVYRFVSGLMVSKEIVEEQRVIPVVTEAPKNMSISEKLMLTGDIKGETEIMVAPRIVGRVEHIYVKEGDMVAKGDKLVTFVSGIEEDDELYADMVTFAPISGIVGQIFAKIGEQASPQVPMVAIYDIDNLKIIVNVVEKKYSVLYAGMPANVVLDAFPGRTFSGAVSNLRPVIDPMSRTIQVEILLPNPGNLIRPGMFCKVELLLNSKAQALVVPADAVLGEQEKYVMTVEDGKAVKKPVKTGIRDGENIEIVSGLSMPDRVIVIGHRVVEEGSQVKEESQ